MAETLHQDVPTQVKDPVWEDFKDEYKDRTQHFIDKNV